MKLKILLFGALHGVLKVIIKVYVPTMNAEEAEVEWFYEDLQDLLELTAPLKKKKKEKMSFSS